MIIFCGLILDPQTNFSLHHGAAGFMDQKSASGQVDDGLFPRQDTPSSSISPFSPSLEDFPGLAINYFFQAIC